MLEDILKYKSLGSAAEIELLITEALNIDEYRNIPSVKSYCVSRLYNFGCSFDGMIQLLLEIGIVLKEDHGLKLNSSIRLPSKNFSHDFFFPLFLMLDKYDAVQKIFPPASINFDSNSNIITIKQSLIPNKFTSLKRFLLDTGFLETHKDFPNRLVISQENIDIFHSTVLPLINNRCKKNAYTLEDLKNRQRKQEEAGLQAEEFVVEFEKRRLVGHANLELIDRVSDDVSLGFDIISFDSNHSLVLDRHIEVKSYVGNMTFFWTENEVNTSREKGDSYFLYLVDRDKIESPSYSPWIIQNPYKNIFNSSTDWFSKPVSWFFEYSNS